jgi:hypothetical protein
MSWFQTAASARVAMITGMQAYHTFLLLGTNEGCHIVTEEVVKGPGAVEFREKQPNVMHEGHDLWLRSLKQRSDH